MSRISFLLFCVSVVLLHAGRSSQSADMDHHLQEMKEHYEHISYIAEFKCHSPQPRVISVHQLFSESQTHGKAFFPDVTVLHRCDFLSGCCTSGLQCGILQAQPALLPFKVTFLEDSGQHRKGSWAMEHHLLVNHTECGCVRGQRPSPSRRPTTTIQANSAQRRSVKS